MENRQLEELVLESKNNKQRLNDLLDAYKPFIASCAQKAAWKKFLKYGDDDELSIAMMAFVQAVKGYKPENGDFLKYASIVIRTRVIDYYRSQKKHSANILYIREEEEKTEETADIQASLIAYGEKKSREDRQLEIMSLKEALSQFGINFFELENVAPKNKQTRKICRDVILYLFSNQELRNETMRNKCLPLAEIEKGLGVKRKKFERHRKYIMAVLVIKSGEYPYLAEYVRWCR